MLAPFASMQLESDLPRFGNPNRFNPVGKCSRSCKAGVPRRVGSQAEGERNSLMRLAQLCESVEDSGDPIISCCVSRRNRPKLRLDISQCVAEIAMFAGKPFNSS